MIWQDWWIWVAFGIALAILEVLLPGFVALGFAVGAVIVGILVAIGWAPSLPFAILVFAIASLAAWWGIRKLAGERKGQVKIWTTDINDD